MFEGGGKGGKGQESERRQRGFLLFEACETVTGRGRWSAYDAVEVWRRGRGFGTAPSD